MLSKELNVLAIGNILKDIIVKVSDQEIQDLGLTKGMMHLVSAEEQHKILGTVENREKTVEMGGSAPNMIRTLAILGQKVCQAGMAGNDHYGNLYIKRVKELGIKNNICQAESGSTGTALILITPDGERTMNTCLGVSRTYNNDHIPTDDIANSKYMVVTGYQWDTDNQIEAMNYALKVAKDNGTKVAFDLSDPFCIDRHKDTFIDILKEHVSIVFANEKEAEMLTGKGVEESLQILGDMVDIVVLKCGSKGAWIKQGTEEVFVKSNKINVVDTTAAGDMYAGGFMYGLLEGMNLSEAGHIATYCAETVIQNIGAQIPQDLLAQATAYLAEKKAPVLAG